jgi:hypothetical protein
MMPEPEPPPLEHFRPHGLRPRDFVLPICALFVSVVSLAVAVLHGQAMEKMAEANARLVEANSWPYLQYETGNQADNGDLVIGMSVANAGVGPAKVESFEVSWAGQPVRNQIELLQRCCGLDPKTLVVAAAPPGASLEAKIAAAKAATKSSIASTFQETGVLEAHKSASFLTLPLTPKTAQVWKRLNDARGEVGLRACYCSVFDECWMSDLRTLRPPKVTTCPVPKVQFGS